MSFRGDVISIVVRIAAATALSWLTFRYLVRYLDPNYAAKEKAKKQAEVLLRSLHVDPNIELNEYELRIAAQFVLSSDGVSWSELGGCDDLIKELNDRIILPLQIRSNQCLAALSSPLLSPPKGALLYGPPGCGKTLLARAIAKAANARFINLQVSILTDKWYGESQKLAAAVFSLARKFQPTIIFIDEIDSFLRSRQVDDHEATAMMKAEFMSLWDGFVSSDSLVIVMGATNRPGDVDKAILRRMPARFHVSLPNHRARAEILKVILRNESVSATVNFDKVAFQATDMSGSDLKEICRLAVLHRFKKLYHEAEGSILGDEVARMLTEDDLITALEKYKKTMCITPPTTFIGSQFQ